MKPWAQKEDMDCKRFEKLIPDFIGQKMDYPTLKRFMGHRQKCGDCKEELEIQFLVSEGIQRLEDGNAFDLQAELEHRLEEAGQKIRFHDGIMSVGLAVEAITVCLLAGFVIWMLL